MQCAARRKGVSTEEGSAGERVLLGPPGPAGSLRDSGQSRTVTPVWPLEWSSSCGLTREAKSVQEGMDGLREGAAGDRSVQEAAKGNMCRTKGKQCFRQG